MTLIIGWLACDQNGPCSAYMASDSRISNKYNSYDYSQKLFALKCTPDILGYCGETIFTSQCLSRLTSICDEGHLLCDNMTFSERSDIIFAEIQKDYERYNLNNERIKIYHIGRELNKTFCACEYACDGKKWDKQNISTDYSKSTKLFCEGSGSTEYEKRFRYFEKGNNEDTSRNYFHCFCDILKDIKDSYTGGNPQLVGLYDGKYNGMYHGTIIGGKTYYKAIEIDNVYNMSGIRWYNEKFEICDFNSKKKKIGAMSQPISKRQLPDSPFSKS